ncbi:MAG: potassium-transporting ATPase subunit C [Gemmiger sp.]|nr:potassium-transporting ATPase subunit C [Gemmiger sp.]
MERIKSTKSTKGILPKALVLFLVFTLLCGVVYTGIITAFAQVFFPGKANGSVIEVNGVKYGSSLLAQQYTDDAHLWGRIMNLDVTTYRDADGQPLLYAAPSNLSPLSTEYAALVAERVAKIKAADPAMGDAPIPQDLVTCSGSGLDPEISPAAAAYQVPRVAAASGKTEQEVRDIIKTCTTGRFLGLFGEETVNVLKVNLMLDGIL